VTSTVSFRRIARRELNDAIAWYEERRVGLGQELLAEVDRVVSRVTRDPSRYPKAVQDVRVARLRRFPYSIFFLAGDQQIVVLAVFHARRDPSTLLDRASR